MSEHTALTGGWCWFHGPRAVTWHGSTVLGYVRPEQGGGAACLGFVPLDGGPVREVVLQAWPTLDDHDVPAVLPMPDGTLLTAHTGHQDTNVVELAQWHRSPAGADRAWSRRIPLPGRTTYANLLPDPDGGVRLVTRVETLGQVLVRIPLAPGDGDLRAAVLVAAPGSSVADGSHRWGRPYALVRQHGPRTWLVATDDHPRNAANGLWCGIVDGDMLRRADGGAIRALAWTHPLRLRHPGPSDAGVRDLTCVRPPDLPDVPWPHDLAFDPDGRPTIAYSTRPAPAGDPAGGAGDTAAHLAYTIARLQSDGTWQHRHVASAGTALYPDEADYAGGIALNPADPSMAVLSTSADPRGLPGERARATWRLVTADLASDPPTFQVWPTRTDASAIRPVFSAPGPEGHALAHLEGDYRSFRDYDLGIVVDAFTPGTTCFDGDGHADLEFPLTEEPELPQEEREALLEHLATARRYLEFGGGGSTLIALGRPGIQVTTVESSGRLLRALGAAAVRVGAGDRFTPVHVPLPLTAGWGRVVASTPEEVVGLAHRYVGSVPQAAGPRPDLILVDGRFRVACFLRIAMLAEGPVTVLWDDYADRPEYQWVESLVAPVGLRGRMAVFALDGPIAVSAPDYLRSLASDL